MTDQDQGKLVLAAARRGGGGPRLLPEQSAFFDLALRNEGQRAVTAPGLEGNLWTPVFRAYDASGKMVIQGTNHDADERAVGEMGEPEESAPERVTLASGEEQRTWADLWYFGAPLPPGRYAFEALHHASPPPAPGTPLVSNRVPFEVVEARVGAWALGYESAFRKASTLAWIAAPREGGAAELLVRLSGFSDHTTSQDGATSHGVVPEDARVAVSQVAPDASGNWLGWVAVAHGAQVELMQQNMTFPEWRSGPIALPIADALPVPRFPDRGHAVFLATGARDGHPALAGVIVRESAAAHTPWSVPLAARPDRSACAFSARGAVSLLLVTDDGQAARLSRLDVHESGAVTSAERVVRVTPHEVLAVAVDMRPGAPQAFVVLEADRTAHDRVALVRLPIAGPPPAASQLAALPGWPIAPQDAAAPRPLRARELSLEVAPNGAALIALVDDQGRLYGGRADGALSLLREGGTRRALHPHVGATHEHHAISCFTEQGTLFHAGGH
jgi:hypothetical protein